MQNIHENWGFYNIFWNIVLLRLSGRVLMVLIHQNHAYEIPRSPGRFFCPEAKARSRILRPSGWVYTNSNLFASVFGIQI